MCRPSPVLLASLALAACSTSVPDEAPAPASVVFTYPVDGQRDVPLGARLVVSFSEPVDATCSVVGPDGPVDAAIEVVGGGRTLAIRAAALQPGTTYELSVSGGEGGADTPLLSFTTRSDRPLRGAPMLVAFDGSDPATPGTFRPIVETAALQLVFSEPLDPRSVALEPGAIELIDAQGAAVPATLVARGIHAVIDPAAPLVPGAIYELRLGNRLVDLGGEPFVPIAVPFTPVDSTGRGAIRQVFRTRQAGDPVASIARTDAVNEMQIVHPLIGETVSVVEPNALVTELGDPLALGGPVAFRIPRGQRLTSSALDIALAGAIPAGLSTGEISIELVADGTGRLYRNRYRPADAIPDNTTSPLLVDLSLDLAVYATDATGNAVLAQTVLGVQLSGIAIADEGALAIETLGALDIGLLGISSAPANIVLDLISAPDDSPAADVTPPALATTLPPAGSDDWAADDGLELVFDEPIDLDRARAGGIRLLEATDGSDVPAVLELHGSVVVLRPRAPLPDAHRYRVELADVADRAGNAAAPQAFEVGTQLVVQTAVPPSVIAIQPGAPCALTDGRCTGANPNDDRYQPFSLAANERVAVVFDQPLRASSLVLGSACDTGSVRVERLAGDGTCLEPVAGTLLRRGRELAFIPAHDWVAGEHYLLRLVSGTNTTCDDGEVCGANGRPANFDALAGTTASGGPDLAIAFDGAPATSATTLLAAVAPSADLNGSGQMEQGEHAHEDNRVALRIAGTSGLITSASFDGPDCVPSTPEVESCMYLVGAIPARLGERRDNCTLPDGSTVASCVPVTMSAQAMYSTSVAMTARALGIGITTSTGMSVMRVRERPDGPLEGFIVDRDGTPTMVVALDLYMDAPDMSLPLAQHDMHSKPLSVALEGPLSFSPDGRIAIDLRNTADVPIAVGINAPLGITGTVDLVVPAGEMRLRLMSRAQRGSLP